MSKKNGKVIDCVICGKSFYIKRRRFEVAKYCSWKCAGIGKRGIIPPTAFKKNDLRITGVNNYQWKGEEASYVAHHRWIKKWGDNINKCEHCGSEKESTYQWANISGEYKRDLSDWLRLCIRCHFKFDNHTQKVKDTWERKSYA